MKITVSEVFYSFQGEGMTAGRPAVFIRLTGCDLKCTWCDTKYTWHKDYLEKRTLQQEVKVFAEKVNKRILEDHPVNRIVITGGEPMLQIDAIIELINHLWLIAKNHLIFEMETNGNHFPFDKSEVLGLISYWNISPKLSTSGNNLRIRYNRNSLFHYNALNNSIFKFVITHQHDIAEIKMDFEFLHREKIWLMPEGTDSHSQLDRLEWIANVCKENGWNFMPRLQILTYEDKRGI